MPEDGSGWFARIRAFVSASDEDIVGDSDGDGDGFDMLLWRPFKC